MGMSAGSIESSMPSPDSIWKSWLDVVPLSADSLATTVSTAAAEVVPLRADSLAMTVLTAAETASAPPVTVSNRSPGVTSSRSISRATPSARSSLKPLPPLPMTTPASLLRTSNLSVTSAEGFSLRVASRSHMVAMQRCCASSGGLMISIRPPTTKSRVSVKVQPDVSRNSFSPAPALPTIAPTLSPSRMSLASGVAESSVIIGCGCGMYGLGSPGGPGGIAAGW
mmetsp:Transcript_37188/g.86901  ORF Transcript_37188/g.86901 Transcript_37188/m.86901 type:complete len:225 (-) Transcript_37188:326-1000(-)